MKKLISLPLVVTFVGILAITTFVFAIKPSDNTNINPTSNVNYSVFALDLPETIAFAGEKAPLNYIDIQEAYDREILTNTYWQSQTLLFIKRANKYFPFIEKILISENIPDDFKYIPLIESGFLHVISGAGAEGFWQFIEPTGKELGLTINKEVDERYHLEKATRAACRYFRKNYEEFGSWTLAAASYNAGRTRIKDAIEKQKANNFYDLWLNAETSRYIYRILAIKSIIENPQKFGFYLDTKHLYNEVHAKKIEVKESIEDLNEFAISQGTNFKMLKTYNPWLKSDKLTIIEPQKYIIEIPLSRELSN